LALIMPREYFKIAHRDIFHYLLPNSRALISKRLIVHGKKPVCSQKSFFTGAGKIELGNGCIFGFISGGFYRGGCIEFQARSVDAIISIGNLVKTNNNIFICSVNFISVGGNTLIGQYVTIIDHDGHALDPSKRNELGEFGKVMIGKNVWIGNNVTILKNTEIGDNTVIATGAVVSGNFPANVIIGGVPAKIIRSL